ncbi:MAG TPA: polysaccharide biosynthesis/export family protein [Bryobacteraceae bacterium]|nr:polysaccharide biosynthesis/export family protein [Bryobacteraceae bacterium]
MKRWRAGIGAALWLAAFGAARAQDQRPAQAQAQFKLPNKELQYSPAEALRAFEGTPEESYHLGEGDEINVQVWGRAEVSGKQVIGPDGRITLPLAGAIPLSGLTREEAAQAVRKVLSPYYTEPQVTVTIDRYTNERVYVLGRVSHPGALQFDRPPTLLDALSLAGGLPIGGIGAEKAGLTRCAIFRGRDKVAWVDLRYLLKEGNLSYNLRLQRNDVVYIPDAGDQSVYVLGEVNHPGAYRLTSEMSFLDALAQAGGPTADAAPGKIDLVRPEAGLHRQFALADFVKGKSKLNVSLNDGDIIYVPARNMAKVGYVLQKIAPLGSIAILGAAVRP